jgi:hypothetical protein
MSAPDDETEAGITFRGYRAWQPYKRNKLLLEQVEAVFEEYEDNLPLTIRQVFYRLVGAYGYDKSDTGYDRLVKMLERARRARVIPWEHLRDDGIRGEDPGRQSSRPDDPEEWLTDYLEEIKTDYLMYRVSLNTGQSKRIELWCEAGGMKDQLERVANDYAVPVFSGGGTESLTARRQVVDRAARQPELETVVLHIGDHDVDGVDIFRSFSEDVEAFLAVDEPGACITFERVAVTRALIASEGLVTVPLKPTKDKRRQARYDRWYADGNKATAQAEALPPDRLAEIVRDAIEGHVDLDQMEEIKQAQADGRRWLQREFNERFGGDDR